MNVVADNAGAKAGGATSTRCHSDPGKKGLVIETVLQMAPRKRLGVRGCDSQSARAAQEHSPVRSRGDRESHTSWLEHVVTFVKLPVELSLLAERAGILGLVRLTSGWITVTRIEVVVVGPDHRRRRHLAMVWEGCRSE